MISEEHILDECVTYLKNGRSVDFCVSKYPKISGLREKLVIAKHAYQISKKEPALNRDRVWKNVSAAIASFKSQAGMLAYNNSPFQIFKFTFSKALFSVVTVVAVIGLLNTTAVAAQNSLPGQTLYPVKRTVEKIELTLTLDQSKKSEVRLKHAEHRLTEAKTIVENTDVSENKEIQPDTAAVIQQALNESADATAKVAEESTDNKDILKKVVELTDKQESVLTDIEGKVSGDAKDAVSSALTAVSETKETAEKSLAQLEQNETEAAVTTTPTTTPQKNEDENSDKTGDNPDRPTSTDDNLNALGDLTATTSDEILPELFDGSASDTDSFSGSSTIEIIELK